MSRLVHFPFKRPKKCFRFIITDGFLRAFIVGGERGYENDRVQKKAINVESICIVFSQERLVSLQEKNKNCQRNKSASERGRTGNQLEVQAVFLQSLVVMIDDKWN